MSGLGVVHEKKRKMSTSILFQSEDRALLDSIVRARTDLPSLVPDPYEDASELTGEDKSTEFHRINAHAILLRINTARPPCEFLARLTMMRPQLQCDVQFVTDDFTMCGWAHIAEGRVEKCRLAKPNQYADDVLWSLPTHYWMDAYMEIRGTTREGSQRDPKPEMSVFTLLPRA